MPPLGTTDTDAYNGRAEPRAFLKQQPGTCLGLDFFPFSFFHMLPLQNSLASLRLEDRVRYQCLLRFTVMSLVGTCDSLQLSTIAVECIYTRDFM